MKIRISGLDSKSAINLNSRYFVKLLKEKKEFSNYTNEKKIDILTINDPESDLHIYNNNNNIQYSITSNRIDFFMKDITDFRSSASEICKVLYELNFFDLFALEIVTNSTFDKLKFLDKSLEEFEYEFRNTKIISLDNANLFKSTRYYKNMTCIEINTALPAEIDNIKVFVENIELLFNDAHE